MIVYMVTSIQKALAKKGDNILSASSIYRKQSNGLHLLLSKIEVSCKEVLCNRKSQLCNKLLGEIVESLIAEVGKNKLNKQLL